MTAEQKLKELILTNYKSINQFSKIIGVNESTVRSILNDHGIPRAHLDVLFKITTHLGIDTDSLMCGDIVYTCNRETDLIRRINHLATDIRENPCFLNGRYLTSDEKETIIRVIRDEVEKLK